MLKRMHLYFKERYPFFARLVLGFIVFLEIYFIVLLNNGVTQFNITIQEFIGGYTVFAFLYWLRVADDLKDYETDIRLFPERPLPSGRVQKKDIIISCLIINGLAIALNIIYMNNLIFLGILYVYGFLMSRWFFARNKIQPSLVLAVITHNPVQMIVNLYIISFTRLWLYLLCIFQHLFGRFLGRLKLQKMKMITRHILRFSVTKRLRYLFLF